MKKNTKIVCLGGGIGTMNLVRGLKDYIDNLTVVVSMADDGGSAGRLRRFYNVPPPGDLINCVSAMSNSEPILKELLKYRFEGNRYGSDSSLPGHKLGNLILVALSYLKGDFYKGLLELQKIFKVKGKIIPSTSENISIWAETSLGEKVYGERHVDLGKFKGRIEAVHLSPKNPKIYREVKEAILSADVIIGGPGDLYTTLIPVLLVPDIQKAVKKSKAKKIFVINVANKDHETPDYKIEDYINAVEKHCGSKIFDYFLANNNLSVKIPNKWIKDYAHVSPLDGVKNKSVIEKDLVDESFSLYHDSKKLARSIMEFI